jgi:hypothetical protein
MNDILSLPRFRKPLTVTLCSYDVKDERAVTSRPLFSTGATVLCKRKSEACGSNSVIKGHVDHRRVKHGPRHF